VQATSQYFVFDNATNTFTVGGTGFSGAFSVINDQADSVTPQTISHNFRGFYNTNFFNSTASNILVDLTPDSFGDVSEEIYINVIGDKITSEFAPGNTGFGDTYYVNAEIKAGQVDLTSGGEYTSAIFLDETFVTARGFNYKITNTAKFQSGTVGTMTKTTSGFNIVLNASGDENGDASTTLNDNLTGFNIFMQGQAKTNGATQFIGVDVSLGFSGTSKSSDSFYGVRLSNGSVTLPNATNYYSWYSQGGEMFVQSNLATRRNLTLQTASSQTARAITVQDSSGTFLSGIAANGAYELPQLTTTQINAISSPRDGMLVYNTTINHVCARQAGAWVRLSHSPM